jgi:hypothetical protein
MISGVRSAQGFHVRHLPTTIAGAATTTGARTGDSAKFTILSRWKAFAFGSRPPSRMPTLD